MPKCVAMCEKYSPMLSRCSTYARILGSTSFDNNILFSWVDASYSGSKTARVSIPKVHIIEKLNIKIEKNVKNNVEWALCGDQ
jgi:hypothetical protein